VILLSMSGREGSSSRPSDAILEKRAIAGSAQPIVTAVAGLGREANRLQAARRSRQSPQGEAEEWMAWHRASFRPDVGRGQIP
jgi:hypothetical protein